MNVLKSLLALFVIAPVLLSCSQEQPPIKIGVVLPLSGAFSNYGQKALKGAQLAVEQINQSGGVKGRKFELIVRDNETTPGKTVKYSRELIQIDNVLALLGPVSSSSRYAMSEVAEMHKTPMLYGIDYEGRHFNEYLICYSTIPEQYINPLIPYAIDKLGDQFYIFGYDYIWPHRMSKRIIEQVEHNNSTISGVEFAPFGVLDYTHVLDRIEQSKANVLMLILPGSDGFRFLHQMHQYPFSRPIEVIAFAADETYLANVQHEALDGIYTALNFFSDLGTQVERDFAIQFRQMHGNDSIVTYSTKSHYDLIYLLKQAIEASESYDKQTVMNNLENLTLYQGESMITLRADHHVALPMYLGQFQGDALKVVHSFGIIEPDDQRWVTNE